jgi:diaminopimelate epimerase
LTKDLHAPLTLISPNHVAFAKMSGSGNDFILIDHRTGGLEESLVEGFVVGICRRRLSVGADGVILIEPSFSADFRWRFFNADGSGAAMCGNGARCAARFAHQQGICGSELRFETGAGLVYAQVNGARVKIRLTDPHSLSQEVPITASGQTITVSRINTGVPHVVVAATQLDEVDLPVLGREIRFHPQFAPNGANVNFICRDPSGDGIAIRTYERGVEGETLSCGTGAVAGALIAAERFGLASPVRVRTRSGETLKVFFQHSGGRYHDICQEGEARFIYSGVLGPEAWR